jgi:chitosanase
LHNDPTGQRETAVKDHAKDFGIADLDTHIHTYVVLGNDNSKQEGTGGASFHAQHAVGIRPLSIVAVVWRDGMYYGVWDDVDGGNVTGEASLCLG